MGRGDKGVHGQHAQGRGCIDHHERIFRENLLKSVLEPEMSIELPCHLRFELRQGDPGGGHIEIENG